MGVWDKFLLLMWKNWKLQLRRPISFLIEIAIPLLVVVIFVVIRAYTNKETRYEKSYKPYPITIEPENLAAVRAYCPNDNKLVNELMTPFFVAKPFPNATMMEEYLKGPEFEDVNGISIVGIQFEQRMPQELPNNITITFRFGSRYSSWYTDELYPSYTVGFGSRLPSFNDGGIPGYYKNFIQLMYLMTDRLLEKSGKTQRLPEMYLQRFPYPAYLDDQYFKILGQSSLFAYFFMTAFVYACTNMTKSVTYEKEKQLKESMKIMGLPTWLHWTAWYCKMILPFLIIVIGIVIMMKWNTFYGQVMEHTNWFLLFVYFFLFVSCIITFCFALSVFFSKGE